MRWIRAGPQWSFFIGNTNKPGEETDMYENQIKGIVTAVFAAISSLLGVLAVPALLMVASNVVDYATGLMAAKYRGEDIKSYRAFHGVAKKISMWLLVIVGVMLDALISFTTEQMGIKLPINYLVGCIVCVWIICTEILSILENIRDIGGPVPSWIEPIAEQIKDQVDHQGEAISKTDKE